MGFVPLRLVGEPVPLGQLGQHGIGLVDVEAEDVALERPRPASELLQRVVEHGRLHVLEPGPGLEVAEGEAVFEVDHADDLVTLLDDADPFQGQAFDERVEVHVHPAGLEPVQIRSCHFPGT